MPTTCLICCQEAEYFLLPPCNHKEMCWKCCMKLIEGSTFTCPYCNGTPEGTSCILFVEEKQMENYSFQQIIGKNPFRSSAKEYLFYSNQKVAKFVEDETSFLCRLCNKVYDNMNMLKKHLNELHRQQYCYVCLENRKCLLQEQQLFNEPELNSHLKKGEYSPDHELLLYHPYCDFCKERFYDLDAFRAHLRMSSHLKCHICDQNFSKYRYVYYKDYPEIEKHFYKSHFVCDTGNCMGNKLQNVFVSENLLEQHRNRVHNKGGKAAQKKVMNLLLFDDRTEEDMEWDRIGKDFSKEFESVEKSNVLKNEEHRDSIIDIRAFYPNQIQAYNKLSLEKIKEKLAQHIYRPDCKSEVINFTSVPIFYPLEMTNCNRPELERFIRDIFNAKFSEPMIEIFFTRKFDYRSETEYFNEIKRRMWNFSPISYYYVFPQLVRYFKDTNKTKEAMDKYYAESLRSLRVNWVFIFHNKQHYTDILTILQEQIQKHVYKLMMEEKIDLDVYQKYIKDLNPEFYHNNYQKIFYVQKEKIKNMYHMIEKTKINELLKMNWLLKLGLSNSSYKQILDQFYYQTLQNSVHWVDYVTLQELALVYAYVEACLQSFIDKNTYNLHKENPNALMLGTILSKLKVCIPSKELTALKQLEQKSVELAAKLNSYVVKDKKKGVINEEDHPSLLSSFNEDKTDGKLIIFGQEFDISHNPNPRPIKKVNHIKKEIRETIQEENEFPELIKSKPKQKVVEQQDFPALNLKSNLNSKKVKAFQEVDDRSNIEKLGLFNPKSDFVSHRITDEFYEKKQRTKNESKEINTRDWGDEWPTLNQSQELENNKNTKKKKKKEEEPNRIPVPLLEPEEPEEPKQEEVMFKKKTKEELRAEEERQMKKTKGKKGQEDDKPKQEVQPKTEVSNESDKAVKVKKQKKKKVRLDATDSEDEEHKKAEERKKELEQKHRRFMEEEKLKQSLKYHEGFDSLLEPKEQQKKTLGVSLINSLIESTRTEKQEPEIVIKKGKKGKAVVIEKVDFWKL